MVKENKKMKRRRRKENGREMVRGREGGDKGERE